MEFLNFQKNTAQQNIYTIFSIGMYIMSIYQNFQTCISFYRNTNYMGGFIEKYFEFMKSGKSLIENLQSQCSRLNSFTEFSITLKHYHEKLKKMMVSLCHLCNNESKLIKYGMLGHLLQCNYELYTNDEYHDVIMFLIHLNQYNNDIHQVHKAYTEHHINSCTILKRNKNKTQETNETKETNKTNKIHKFNKTKMYDAYYINHMYTNHKCNTIDFNKNILLTGPNASGKTTMIKSTIINLFLSQSIGFGCYSKCKLQMYDYFHSYLNIPDTSNRDSLFQAEARRCKDIIDFINTKRNKNHFCIFDEIYSGTNPHDAVLCAHIY